MPKKTRKQRIGEQKNDIWNLIVNATVAVSADRIEIWKNQWKALLPPGSKDIPAINVETAEEYKNKFAVMAIAAEKLLAVISMEKLPAKEQQLSAINAIIAQEIAKLTEQLKLIGREHSNKRSPAKEDSKQFTLLTGLYSWWKNNRSHFTASDSEKMRKDLDSSIETWQNPVTKDRKEDKPSMDNRLKPATPATDSKAAAAALSTAAAPPSASEKTPLAVGLAEIRDEYADKSSTRSRMLSMTLLEERSQFVAAIKDKIKQSKSMDPSYSDAQLNAFAAYIATSLYFHKKYISDSILKDARPKVIEAIAKTYDMSSLPKDERDTIFAETRKAISEYKEQIDNPIFSTKANVAGSHPDAKSSAAIEGTATAAKGDVKPTTAALAGAIPQASAVIVDPTPAPSAALAATSSASAPASSPTPSPAGDAKASEQLIRDQRNNAEAAFQLIQDKVTARDKQIDNIVSRIADLANKNENPSDEELKAVFAKYIEIKRYTETIQQLVSTHNSLYKDSRISWDPSKSQPEFKNEEDLLKYINLRKTAVKKASSPSNSATDEKKSEAPSPTSATDTTMGAAATPTNPVIPTVAAPVPTAPQPSAAPSSIITSFVEDPNADKLLIETLNKIIDALPNTIDRKPQKLSLDEKTLPSLEKIRKNIEAINASLRQIPNSIIFEDLGNTLPADIKEIPPSIFSQAEKIYEKITIAPAKESKDTLRILQQKIEELSTLPLPNTESLRTGNGETSVAQSNPPSLQPFVDYKVETSNFDKKFFEDQKGIRAPNPIIAGLSKTLDEFNSLKDSKEKIMHNIDILLKTKVKLSTESARQLDSAKNRLHSIENAQENLRNQQKKILEECNAQQSANESLNEINTEELEVKLIKVIIGQHEDKDAKFSEALFDSLLAPETLIALRNKEKETRFSNINTALETLTKEAKKIDEASTKINRIGVQQIKKEKQQKLETIKTTYSNLKTQLIKAKDHLESSLKPPAVKPKIKTIEELKAQLEVLQKKFDGLEKHGRVEKDEKGNPIEPYNKNVQQKYDDLVKEFDDLKEEAERVGKSILADTENSTARKTFESINTSIIDARNLARISAAHRRCTEWPYTGPQGGFVAFVQSLQDAKVDQELLNTLNKTNLYRIYTAIKYNFEQIGSPLELDNRSEEHLKTIENSANILKDGLNKIDLTHSSLIEKQAVSKFKELLKNEEKDKGLISSAIDEIRLWSATEKNIGTYNLTYGLAAYEIERDPTKTLMQQLTQNYISESSASPGDQALEMSTRRFTSHHIHKSLSSKPQIYGERDPDSRDDKPKYLSGFVNHYEKETGALISQVFAERKEFTLAYQLSKALTDPTLGFNIKYTEEETSRKDEKGYKINAAKDKRILEMCERYAQSIQQAYPPQLPTRENLAAFLEREHADEKSRTYELDSWGWKQSYKGFADAVLKKLESNTKQTIDGVQIPADHYLKLALKQVAIFCNKGKRPVFLTNQVCHPQYLEALCLVLRASNVPYANQTGYDITISNAQVEAFKQRVVTAKIQKETRVKQPHEISNWQSIKETLGFKGSYDKHTKDYQLETGRTTIEEKTRILEEQKAILDSDSKNKEGLAKFLNIDAARFTKDSSFLHDLTQSDMRSKLPQEELSKHTQDIASRGLKN